MPSCPPSSAAAPSARHRPQPLLLALRPPLSQRWTVGEHSGTTFRKLSRSIRGKVQRKFRARSRTLRASSEKDHGKFKAGAANAPGPKYSPFSSTAQVYTTHDVYHCTSAPHTSCLCCLYLYASSTCECPRARCSCIGPSHVPGAGWVRLSTSALPAASAARFMGTTNIDLRCRAMSYVYTHDYGSIAAHVTR